MADSIAELFAHYADETRARDAMERLRWPQGPRCVKCGSVNVYRITSAAESTTQHGLLRCRECERTFSVTVGTVFEDSKIPLGKWLIAIHLLCASKKGMSAHQLHRMLGVTYKTAWFMAHRIRYAMGVEPMKRLLSGTVEVDETFVGGKPKNRHAAQRKPAPPKIPVMALVERDGRVHSMKVAKVTGATLKGAVRKYVSRKAKIMTDGYGGYRGLDREYRSHETVDHESGEYVRGNAHVNTVEGYFGLLKRGIIGTYHHVSEQHLDRYLAEFDQRWNTRRLTDRERAVLAVKAAEGKRLTYKPLVAKKD